MPSTRLLRTAAAASLLAFCVLAFSDNHADVDLWGNVGFVTAWPGRPAFHLSNTYSFTEPGSPWVNHEWLSEYVLHAVHGRLGNTGLLGLKLLAGLALVAMARAAMIRSVPSAATRWLYLALIASTLGYGLSPRPHIFTYALYSLALLAWNGLERTAGSNPAAHRRLLLATPAVALAAGALWANLHGAFFVGGLLLAALAVGDALRRRSLPGAPRALPWPVALAAFLLFAAGSLATPYGIRLWGFVARDVFHPRPYLSEWAPFDPAAQLLTHPDFVVLAILTLAAMAVARGPGDAPAVLLVALSLAAAVLMRRNIPLFALTCAFVAPPWVQRAAGKHVDRLAGRVRAPVAAAALALLAALCLFRAATFNKKAPLQIEVQPDRFPVETVEFMKRTGLTGNALVFFDWAEYAIWHLYPGCRVFLDGRFTSAYGRPVIDDYFSFLYDTEGRDRALSRYPTDIALLHAGNPACRRMESEQGWEMVHGAGPARLFVKRSAHGAFLDSLRGTPPARETPAPRTWTFP